MFLLYAQYGLLDVVKLFVQAGMPLTTKNPDADFTVLHQAATYGHLETVKYLVGQGAAVDAEGKSGETPFIWAAWNGHLDVVTYLREQGASLLSSTPVGAAHRLAKDAGHTAVVTYIEGQARAELTKRGIAFTTEVFIVSAGRSIRSKAVKLFVQAGMSLASVDMWGRNALHRAARGYGSLDLVKYLVEQGVSVTATTYEGENRTALYYAARRGHLAMVKYLVGQGASLTATDNDGKTARDLALGNGHTAVVNYFDSLNSGP